MLNQPMSSPMIMMMLGFGCAAAGPVAHASATTSTATATLAILRILSSVVWLSALRALVARAPLGSASQQQLDVWRRADQQSARGMQCPQGSEPRRVRRPQLGEVDPERPRASADDPLELGDAVARQPTLQAHDPDACIQLARDVEGHWPRPSRGPSTEFTRSSFGRRVIVQ